MKCTKITRKEVWKNHPEKLDIVCATNKGNAKRAARRQGKEKAQAVLKKAKLSLAKRMECGGGTCQDGWKCGRPADSDVQEVDKSESLKIEVELVDSQPDPNPCKGRKKQYSATAVIGFTIIAQCKCKKIPVPKDPPKKYRKRKK